MPNHTFNDVIIKGTRQSVNILKQAFVEKKDDTIFDFEAFLPIPEEYKLPTANEDKEATETKLKEKYGATNWFYWCCQNWGTKWPGWDAQCFVLSADLNKGAKDQITARIRFTTAWCAPVYLLEALSRQLNLDLDICYWTELYEDAGQFTITQRGERFEHLADFDCNELMPALKMDTTNQNYTFDLKEIPGADLIYQRIFAALDNEYTPI